MKEKKLRRKQPAEGTEVNAESYHWLYVVYGGTCAQLNPGETVFRAEFARVAGGDQPHVRQISKVHQPA